MSHIGWGGEQITIYKALRGSSKGEAQREQYRLVVDLDLGRYKWY